MSLPSALKVSSGCISTRPRPSRPARRPGGRTAVPAWPAPQTTMSASIGLGDVRRSAISGSSPSQPAPSTSPMVLPALPVAAAAAPWSAARGPAFRAASGRSGTRSFACAGLHPANMPMHCRRPWPPARPRLARKLRRLSSMGPRFLANAARCSSVQRGSFLSHDFPFLSCLGMPRLGRRRGGRTDRGRLPSRRLRAVVGARLVEHPDYRARKRCANIPYPG